MNKAFLQEIKNELVNQKNQIIAQANKEIGIDADGDETDEIQANILIGLNNQLNTRSINKLNQINTALQRIEDKTYGICEDCDDPIAEKRLQLNPYFQTCVFCAEERERDLKQKRR